VRARGRARAAGRPEPAVVDRLPGDRRPHRRTARTMEVAVAAGAGPGPGGGVCAVVRDGPGVVARHYQGVRVLPVLTIDGPSRSATRRPPPPRPPGPERDRLGP